MLTYLMKQGKPSRYLTISTKTMRMAMSDMRGSSNDKYLNSLWKSQNKNFCRRREPFESKNTWNFWTTWSQRLRIQWKTLKWRNWSKMSSNIFSVKRLGWMFSTKMLCTKSKMSKRSYNKCAARNWRCYYVKVRLRALAEGYLWRRYLTIFVR